MENAKIHRPLVELLDISRDIVISNFHKICQVVLVLTQVVRVKEGEQSLPSMRSKMFACCSSSSHLFEDHISFHTRC